MIHDEAVGFKIEHFSLQQLGIRSTLLHINNAVISMSADDNYGDREFVGDTEVSTLEDLIPESQNPKEIVILSGQC